MKTLKGEIDLAHKRSMAVFALSAVAAVTLAGGATVASASVTVSHRDSSSLPPLEVVPSPNGTFQDNFNPFTANNNGGNYGTLGMIYEPLFYFDNVTGKTFDLLGTSYSWSDGNKTLTVELRKNATWSDGKPFTSADVVFTFAELKKYPAADTTGDWQALTSVQAKGDHAVVFRFKTANVPFAEYVLNQFIVPAHIWKSIGNPVKTTITKPVGTGPYVLASFSTQDYKYDANPHYWGGKPPVPVVDFPAYSGNDSGDMALAKGDIDWAGMFIPGIQKIFVSHDPAHNHYFFPPDNVIMLYTNLKNPLLAQLPVREAISLAIDRNALGNEGEYGYAKPANPLGLVLPNNAPWVDPALKNDLSFSLDPSRAVQILERAGFKRNSQGIFEKGGKSLSFTIQAPAGWTDWDADMQLIQENLKKVGIQITIEEPQFGAYNANVGGTKKTYDLALSWTNTGPSPYFLYYNMLDANGNYNVEQLNDPSVNGWLSNFSATSDLAQEKADIYKLEGYMAAQLPSIPLFYGPVWYEYRDANYTGFPTASNTYINPAPWQNYAQAIVLMHLRPVK